MSKLSIVVPVYWNSDTLMLLYEDMKEKVLSKLGDYEIVFVDDGSGDNSWEIMNQIRDMDENVKLVKLSRNFGEHAAILAGLSQCTGDCAVTKQADLQEDSELILQMYDKWKEGNKVVLAVRADRDEGAVQKFFANLYYTLMRKLVIKDMPKGGFDCYLLDRQVIQVLLMLDEKNSALTLQVLWVGFKSDKVYFHRKAREIGESRWTLSKKVKLVIDSMMSFSYFPVRFMSGMGVASAAIGVIWAIILMIQKIMGIEEATGWTSTMVVMLFFFGMIMLMLGILGEYIWRALDASRNRPPFLVDETRGFDKPEGTKDQE
ncbi:MAG: glycosyltransferase family 2 protein [Lachnospiraceae bacterium]|nr:glycosyltransferase family 2 protein [Lachnospiraceae bacterium]